MPWLGSIGIRGLCGNGIGADIVAKGERGHLKHGVLACGLELQWHKSLLASRAAKEGGLLFPTFSRSGKLQVRRIHLFLICRRTARLTTGW